MNIKCVVLRFAGDNSTNRIHQPKVSVIAERQIQGWQTGVNVEI